MTSDRSVITDSLGVGLATGAYGVSFGALGVTAGLDVWQTCVLSLAVFTGASQFAFIGVLASGGTSLAATVTGILLGSRNMFYGVALAPLLQLRGSARLASAHLVIDESTAMAVTRESTRQARLGFYWTGVCIFVLWNLSTFLGALGGTAIGDPRAFGLDAAVGAAFLGLLWPRLSSRGARAIAALAAAVALALVPFTAAGVPIIVGGAVAVLVGLLRHIRPPEDLP
ncbi:AzlC family ABC transporter permease [Aeromicrobium sp.]|uniref:AzlC family ABC transporter permease n=1 Tax=Aeromicrobium sp. TaxID=1871063 RepID=UPI003D6C221C